jgi:hypothetical protein
MTRTVPVGRPTAVTPVPRSRPRLVCVDRFAATVRGRHGEAVGS